MLYENLLTTLPPLHNPLLQELWLNGNRIATLASPEPFPAHQTGDHWQLQQEAQGRQTGGRVTWCPLLTRLHLHDNSVATLGCLRGFPMLTTLTLSFNALADAAELRHLRALRHLTSVTVNDNPVAEDPQYRQRLLRHVRGA